MGYRDRRTEGMDHKVEAVIPQEELYRRTGIQKQSYNTIYQLQAIKEKHPEQLEKAENMLMLPDYFHFLLSGEKKWNIRLRLQVRCLMPKQETGTGS